MPPVGGVLETALWVDDLQRARKFYQSLFGFEVLFADERIIALHVPSPQILLLCLKGASLQPTILPGGTIPAYDGTGQTHLCFSIPVAGLQTWEQWLARNGVAIESRVNWDRGGHSVYFRDPDQHLLELATPGTWRVY